MNVTLKAGTTLANGAVISSDMTLELPRLKFGVMGRPGSGKSRLLASMPKPAIYLCADVEEKLQPYFDRCGDVKRTTGQFGQTVLIGHSAITGKPLMQLEIYADENPEKPTAFTNVLARADQLRGEVVAGQWASVGLDPWSQFETLALWRRRWGAGFIVQDFDAFGRGAAAAANDLKMLVMARLIALPCNVGIAFHTSEKAKDESGVNFFGIKAVTSALPTDLAGLMPERYRSESLADGTTRRLWTRPDGRFDLCTLIDAPSPCANEYTALWANWIQKRAAAMVAAQQATETAAQIASQGEVKP